MNPLSLEEATREAWLPPKGKRMPDVSGLAPLSKRVPTSKSAVRSQKLEPERPLHLELQMGDFELRRPRASKLLDRIARSGDGTDLGALAEELVALATEPGERAKLETWIQHDAKSSLLARRPELAAVVEAAVRLSLPSAGVLIEAILRDEGSEPTVAAVAAQRARLVTISDAARRAATGHALLGWIERWERNPEAGQKAAIALPSLPLLLGHEAVEALVERVRSGIPIVAWGAAVGLVDWLTAPGAALDSAAAARITDVVLQRIEDELAAATRGSGPDLVAMLVWLIGLVAPVDRLHQAAVLLARTFAFARGVEDAAAVRAGRALVGRWKLPATQALMDALGADRDLLARFMTLLVSAQTRP